MARPNTPPAYITRGPNWAVWPGVDDDGAAVAVKAHDGTVASALSAARFHRELEILHALDGVGTPRGIGLTVREGRPGLVLQDLHDYCSVADLLRASGALRLDRFFGLAARIAAALGEVHQRGVIHKALRPEHVLATVDGRVLLFGFEQATRMAEEEQRYDLGAAGASALAYVSPEQTGRMNRPIDYRTDLYSAGLLFYEMLAGRLPFPTLDVVGTIHAHVAMTPPALRSVRAEAPPALEAILAKLLSKSPDDRYQNAFALEDDLRLVAAAWHEGRELAPGALGATDHSGRFVLSQRLYGRQAAADTLVAHFERVAAGQRTVVFLTGSSGIGKTALVHETHRPLAERRGIFASGKFDQYGRFTPFAGLRRAFGALFESIAEGQPTLRERLARELGEDLGSSVSVLLDVLPELALLVEATPAVPEVGGADVEDRFRLAFRRLVEVLARREPFVLFLDDLQWVDAASLRILEDLASADEITHLLVVAAYRHDEVEPEHPLALAMHAMEARRAPTARIALARLTSADVRAFVADSLPGDPDFLDRLTAHVVARTDGNPFFVRRLLQSLHDDRHLRFDFKAGRWTCDFEAVERSAPSADVVDLVLRQLRRLPEEVVSTLSLAACIGDAFDLGLLAGLARLPPRVVAERAWLAARAGMITLVTGREWTELGAGGDALVDENASDIVYRFRHDRVQQAAASLIAPADLPDLHLAICRQLRASERHRGGLFETAGHCVRGLGRITEPAELLEVVGLLLQSAGRAVSVNAAAAAEEYCRAALQAVEGPLAGQVQVSFEARKLLGESLLLRGDFDGARRAFDDALRLPLQKLDRVAILTLTMELWVSQGQLGAALATLVQILGTFGVPLDETNVAQAAATASERIQRARRGRTAQQIVDSPEATDPEVVALLEVLARASDTAYMSGRTRIVAIGALALTTVLEHGATVAASMTIATYAVADGEPTSPEGIARRAEYGRIGSMLADRYGAPAWIARANVSNAPHFDRTFREAIARFDLAATTGWESSALSWASYADVRSLCTMLVAGVRLDRIDAERRQRVVRIRRAHRSVSEVCCDALERLLRALRQPPDGPEPTPGDDALEARLARSGPWAACVALGFDQLLAIVFERWGDAAAAARAMVPVRHALDGMTNEHWFHLFEAIRLVNASADDGAGSAPLPQLEDVERFLEARCPTSPDHAPSLHVARGLRARVEGNPHRPRRAEPRDRGRAAHRADRAPGGGLRGGLPGRARAGVGLSRELLPARGPRRVRRVGSRHQGPRARRAGARELPGGGRLRGRDRGRRRREPAEVRARRLPRAPPRRPPPPVPGDRPRERGRPARDAGPRAGRRHRRRGHGARERQRDRDRVARHPPRRGRGRLGARPPRAPHR
jgi:predicted ATPase